MEQTIDLLNALTVKIRTKLGFFKKKILAALTVWKQLN